MAALFTKMSIGVAVDSKNLSVASTSVASKRAGFALYPKSIMLSQRVSKIFLSRPFM